MPNVKGRVLKSGIKDGKFLCLIQVDGKPPRPGEWVSLKFGATRSLSQNALYFAFLQWLLDSGLKDEYGCVEELHESLKAAFLSKPNALGLLKIGSTTDLDKITFGEYIEKVNLAMIDHCGIDTAPFWEDYEKKHEAA